MYVCVCTKIIYSAPAPLPFSFIQPIPTHTHKFCFRKIHTPLTSPPLTFHPIPPSGEIKFSASSPDDEALVCAARYFGFAFEVSPLFVCFLIFIH